jgi:hypothetical protein
VARVGHDQKDALEAAIAELQGRPPQLRLQVDEPCLDLHGQGLLAAAQAGDQGIPGALIARPGEGDLESDIQAAV